jgi:hypothetical protein
MKCIRRNSTSTAVTLDAQARHSRPLASRQNTRTGMRACARAHMRESAVRAHVVLCKRHASCDIALQCMAVLHSVAPCRAVLHRVVRYVLLSRVTALPICPHDNRGRGSGAPCALCVGGLRADEAVCACASERTLGG